MKKQSAGILPYKFVKGELFFFIAHPGGPFYRKKDEGAWNIVKGEIEEGEDPLKAAIREFKEETTITINGDFWALKSHQQKGGKLVHVWAVETDFPTEHIKSNTFQLEWPPKSGKMAEFPELDKFEWFDLHTAKSKLLPSQLPFLEEAVMRLQSDITGEE